MTNSIFKTATFVALTSVAAPVAAQDMFSGGEIALSYSENTTYDYGASNVAGSFVGQYGNFVGQLDISSGYFDASANYTAITLHLGYTISAGTKAGVFYSSEDWGGEYVYPVWGAEFAYETEKLDLDAAYLSYRSHLDTSDEYYNILQVEAKYHLNEQFDVLGYVAKSSYQTVSSSDGMILGLGGRYNLASGAYVELGTYNHFPSSDLFTDFQMVEVRLGYEFGNGKVFGGRNYLDYFPAY